MENLRIIKRNGVEVSFDKQKIINAISKANISLRNPQLSKEQIEEIADYIEYKCSRSGKVYTVEEIQDLVENQIMATGAHDLARAYVRYRYEHMNDRKFIKLPTKEEKEILNDLKIRKKSGTIVNYNADKILSAISKSAERARADKKLTEEEKASALALIEVSLINFINKNKDNTKMPIVSTEIMHTLVETALERVAPDVGDAYSRYHSFRMSQAASWEHVMGKCTTLLGDDTSVDAMTQKNQNANADATLASTMKCFFADYTTEEYYNEFFLTKEEKQIAEDGYLYWHDKNGRMIYPLNCCLFDMGYVLEHGFEMNGVWYNQPKTLDVAFDVIGDLTLMSASQQYGGFTVPRIDTILVPYAEKSFKMYYDKYISLGVSPDKAEEAAIDDIQREMEAGFQGLEYKFNTVASSRGDYPFTTITFGLDTSRFGRMAAITALKVRMKGQGKKGKKKPVLFPKLTFLYDKNLHGKGCVNNDIYEVGIECSSKTMYPDWLSLTGEGYIPSMYKKYGIKGVISLMGCRASLSPYYVNGGFHPQDDNDYPVFEGRFNLGVISLNLPMILAKSRKEDKDFYEVLTYYLEVIRDNHKRTREYIGHMKASRNPVGFCYGGFYGGHLKPEEEIAPVLEYSTMSFGITALNELQQLYNGKSLVEDGNFALEVMKYINEYVNRIKEEDHILYAIYGTPAENLCLDGNTLVQTYEGNKKIKDITTNDLVYSYNEETKKIELKRVLASRMTQKQAITVTVKFDNGQEIICTPNHPFAVRKMKQDTKGRIIGEYIDYVYANDLKPGNRIKSNYIKIDNGGHKITSSGQWIHEINAEYKYGIKPKGFEVHHKNLDKLDNSFNNLEYLSYDEHRRLHMKNTIMDYQFTSEKVKGQNNPFYGKKHTEKSKKLNKIAHYGKNNVSSKAIVQLDLNGNLVATFESRSIAEKELNISNISYACNGKYTSKENPHEYKGYLWYFASNLEEVKEQNHKVVSVTINNEPIPVYCLEVEDNHNYYIGGDDGILVHNCGKQVKQFRAKYGIVKNVSDREYVSNSFHCHVTEDITPFEKQDLEYRFWDYFNGGKIQYCRYTIGYNLDAIKTLVERAMEMGLYEGVNLSLCFCDDCGHKAIELGTVCPKCNGVHITQIDRMNGYLSFTRVGSDTRAEIDEHGNKIITIHSRYSPHKIKEISERKSM